ncbi:MAG: hypothetical protein Q8K92_22925 [Leadbetterella sp.]|nr:hypothetical protein [Leadbetterella sp.]
MKKNQFKFLLILCMGILFLNCKKKVIEEEPVVYDFTKDFKDKGNLPEVKVTNSDTVKLTLSTIKESAEANAIIVSLIDNKKIETGLDKAAKAIDNLLTDTLSKKLDKSFTLPVLDSLTSGKPIGTLNKLSDSLVFQIYKSGALNDLLIEFKFPSIDGVVIGLGRKKVSDPLFIFDPKLNVNYSNASTQDQCSDAAKAAYDKSKKSLDSVNTVYQGQIKLTYENKVKEFNADAASQILGASFKYDSLRREARKVTDNAILAINNLPTVYNAFIKELYRNVFYSLFALYINIYNDALSADLQAIIKAKELNLKSAQTARDNDLGLLKSNYDASLKSIADVINAIPCHNQGGN